MLDSIEPYGRGSRDAATGLFEFYDLPAGHPARLDAGYQVRRTTTERLQAELDALAGKDAHGSAGQELVSAHFLGGRDWVVISRRALGVTVVGRALAHLDSITFPSGRPQGQPR